eukprot:11157746-Lingulodinium_polyedra.AAC.1
MATVDPDNGQRRHPCRNWCRGPASIIADASTSEGKDGDWFALANDKEERRGMFGALAMHCRRRWGRECQPA